MDTLKASLNSMNEIKKEDYNEIIRLLNNKLEEPVKNKKHESLRKAQKKYYENNKDVIREKQHEYMINNIDEIRQKAKLRRERIKEEMKPIKEARKLEKERIKAEKLAEKEANKKPRGRPRLPDDQLKHPRKQPKIIQDENPDENHEIKPEESIKKKPGRPRLY